MAYLAITIKEALKNIDSKRYLTPTIQREVVWKVNQITSLFDSLMRNYPIGSFLFWYVEKKNTGRYQFYEFLRNYHEKDCCHNTKADIRGEDDIIGILDGQQRLASLYIGLKGSYAYKEPWKHRESPQAFPERWLYLNLIAPKKKDDETDMIYDFAFLTKEKAHIRDDDSFWFRVGDVLDLKEPVQVNNYLVKNELGRLPQKQALFASETLFKLWEVVHKTPVINYYLEKDEGLDPDEGLEKVLNIFVRINSGGTVLSYSDLLLSIAAAQWKNREAREEITALVDELNGMGDGFNFDKDLVLKSSIVLAGITDITFKVRNFTKDNMIRIENEWEAIKNALRGSVTLVSAFGYSRYTLTAPSAIIPIAFYMKKIGCPRNFDSSIQFSDDRHAISRWLILSLVKRVFGGTPDSVLRPIREVLRDCSDKFPLEKIIDKFKGSPKSLVPTSDDIENMLQYQYGKGYVFSTLALLYDSLDFRKKFHMDHIHPRGDFTKAKLLKKNIPESDVTFYLENVNSLPNLQLLEGPINLEKSNMDFKKWVELKYPAPENTLSKHNYLEGNYISPDMDLSLTNFPTFIKQRKDLLREKLKTILQPIS